MSLQLAVARAGTVDEYEVDGPLYVGRAADNHIVLDGPSVSRRHARFDPTAEGLRIVDLGSANGTTVNGNAIEPRAGTLLSAGDVVVIGGFVIRAVEPRPGADTAVIGPGGRATARPPEPPRPWLEVTTPAGTTPHRLAWDEVRIGRGSDNDVVIPEVVVSKRHAVIRRSGDSYLFEDLDSANGTYIGDERVRLRQLDDGDRLAIGESVTLVFRTARPEEGPSDGAGASTLITSRKPQLELGRGGDYDAALGRSS